MLDNSQLRDSKLFTILRALSKKELRELELWLDSPIHNSSQEVSDLYRGIRKNHRNLNKSTDKLSLLKYAGIKRLSDDKKQLHPKEEKALRSVMSKLTSQVQEYMLWTDLKHYPFMLKRHTMNAFVDHKLYKYLPHMVDKMRNELNTSSHRNDLYHDATFQLAEIDLYLGILLHNRSNAENKMQSVIDALRQSFLSKLLKYYCAAVSRQKVLQVEYSFPFMDYVKQHLNDSEDSELPAIKIHCTLLLLLESYQREHYDTLKNYLFAHLDKFNKTEIRQFFNHMTNYCNWMIRQGEEDFVLEQHKVFEKGLELGCWSEVVYFSQHQFIHIVKNALKLNESIWAAHFIQEYKKELSPDVKENISSYAFALMCFHNHKFEEAQDFIAKISSTEDFVYHLELRILLIKIYYESTLTVDNIHEHPLNYELEALRQNVSVRNKKMSESWRQAYNNFANVFKRILERRKKVVNGQSLHEGRTEKLQSEIQNLSPLVERGWLEQKVQELLR